MTDENKLEDELDLEEFSKKADGKPAPAARRYKIRIDKTTVTVDKPVLTGRELLSLVGKKPDLCRRRREGVPPHGRAVQSPAEGVHLRRVVGSAARDVDQCHPHLRGPVRHSAPL